jgi:hypothetical protein
VNRPHNGRAGYRSRKTWGTRLEVDHEGPARITAKRVAVRLHNFDRATGRCVDKHFVLANYAHSLTWYEVDGQARVEIPA